MDMIRKQEYPTVLVIDDDVISASVLQASLENLGFHKVGIEHNGHRALERLANEPEVELVLLDLHMPEMDGIRFMRHLSEIRPAMDLIMVSGQRERVLSTAISLGKSMGLNVLGAIQKPIKPARLESLLQRRKDPSRERQEFDVVRRPLSSIDLIAGLETGSPDNKPCLLYQPIVSANTGAIVCVEVLARWWNRERGMLAPDVFLPLAESSGLLDQLTHLIYRETIDQVADWFAMDKHISAAINLSINSFRRPEFTRYLIDTAAQRNIDCARLIFEVAESQTSVVTPQCLEALLSLRLKGFRLSIDDFGTGSSSFTHLKNIPFTELKIDREFVTGASDDPGARSILEESINLARRLSMVVVAEGVETREDWNLVEELGCDYVQGYYCGKPMPHNQILQLLDTWQGPHGRPEADPVELVR
jgi:EAL domain-containing protein (putative c-di-GMP-specific phosphodiesterase class I)